MGVMLTRSRPGDEGRLRNFYNQAPHRHVAFRESLLSATTARGHFFFFEADGDIIGSGAVFVHQIAPEATFVETGQVRVINNGFNLARCLHAIRQLCAFGDFRDAQFVFRQIDADNAHGQAHAREVGCERFTPDAKLAHAATAVLPIDKRAEALGIETIYWRNTEKLNVGIEAYFRENRAGNVIREHGTAGKLDIELHQSVSQMIDRHLPALRKQLEQND